MIQDGSKFDPVTKTPLPEEFQYPPKPKEDPRKETLTVESSVPLPPEPEAEPGLVGGEAGVGPPVPTEDLPELIRLRQEEKIETAEEGRQGFGASVMRGLGFGLGSAPETPPDVIATNAALKLARAHGVDLFGIKGTGRDGRITLDDVNSYIQKKNPEKE